MQKIKAIAPFFLAILLLFLAAFLPIFLCHIQDGALLGVAHSEPVATAAPFQEGRPLDASEKISLICDYGRIGANVIMTEQQNTNKEYSYGQTDSFPTEAVISELKKLQSLGAFPPLTMQEDFTLYYAAAYTYMDMNHPSRAVNLCDYSFYVNDYNLVVSMDTDTNQIYQYSIQLNGASISYDAQAAFTAFSRYLSLDGDHEKLYYSVFQENTSITLALKSQRSIKNM